MTKLSRLSLFTLIGMVFSQDGVAQDFRVLQSIPSKDSSFYHIEKIAENEFWIGGENGLLYKTDTTGELSHINIDTKGHTLLRIRKNKNQVYLLTDTCLIICYNIDKKTASYHYFSNLKKS